MSGASQVPGEELKRCAEGGRWESASEQSIRALKIEQDSYPMNPDGFMHPCIPADPHPTPVPSICSHLC